MKPSRNKSHLAFIKSLPCLVHGCQRWVDPCHVGPHGTSQKASDTQVVPLCHLHHRIDKFALDKGRRKFEAHYGIDLNAVIARLTEKPQLSIRNGKYVAQLGSEEYIVGPLAIGIRQAASRTLVFFRECYIESARRRKSMESSTREAERQAS